MTIDRNNRSDISNLSATGINDSSDWSVPSYTLAFWLGKAHEYCVIIPVINEGGRITTLLERMDSIGIANIADIIIVDGGSTDGSLDPKKLQGLGVRGLLVKTGSGKLSAQLRCGYAFVIGKGFSGVITIDGNNKDDPAAIQSMVNELKSGADFIQASRFVAGGLAENTPLSRHLAIKFIHAPMLRLFSGFRWTDTTQGFRAYSTRLLLDHRVRPFRDCFNTYELLAYLSYRGPRLGFRCSEIGTSRRYPLNEIPTKITAFWGNIEILVILFKACLGLYNPRD